MNLLVYGLIALLVFYLDVITKSWAVANDTIVCAVNYGISWGICSQGLSSGIFFGVISFCIVLFCAYLARLRLKQNKTIYPETFIIAGALANIFSRILYHGGVIDFIDIYPLLHVQFPLFNVADVSVVFGVFLLTLRELLYEKD